MRNVCMTFVGVICVWSIFIGAAPDPPTTFLLGAIGLSAGRASFIVIVAMRRVAKYVLKIVVISDATTAV